MTIFNPFSVPNFMAPRAQSPVSRMSGNIEVSGGARKIPSVLADLYVATTGSDAVTKAANSQLNPWATLERALWGSAIRSTPNASEAVAAGETLLVDTGTYTIADYGASDERFAALAPVNSGSIGNKITIKCADYQGVTIRTSGGGGTATFVTAVIGNQTELNGIPYVGNYIRWENFKIDHTFATPITAGTGSDNGVVIDWAGTGNEYYNLEIVGRDQSATSAGALYAGIRIQLSVNPKVQNCYIRDVEGSSSTSAEAILCYSVSGALFEYNTITNCDSGFGLKGEIGGEQFNQNFTIRHNLVYGNRQRCLYFSAHSGNASNYTKIYQNVFYDVNTSSGGPFINHGTYAANYVYIVNNTFVMKNTTGGPDGWLRNAGGNYTNCILQNNVVYQARTNRWIGYSDSTQTNGFQWDEDFNCYFETGGVGSAQWSYSGVGTDTGIANWRTRLGGCPNTGNSCSSIEADPLFVDYANNDFALQSLANADPADSPCLDAGEDILQLLGGSATAPIHIGAYITDAMSDVFGRQSVPLV